MVIALDMDGTIAGLYSVPSWLERLRDEDATPYLDATPLVDCDALNDVLRTLRMRGHRVEVVSWNCGGNPSRGYAREVRRAKAEWLKRHGIQVDSVHVVKHGTPKQKVVRGHGVLFDDEERNRIAWEASGKGVAYDAVDLVRKLEKIARSKAL